MTHDFADTTVLIPVFNEARTIDRVVRGVRRALGDQVEILVVDDGSSDASASLARQAGATVLTLGTNQGKGQALRTGFRAATRDFVVTIDADGQDDPMDLPALLQATRNGADMVIGSRFMGTLHPNAISRINALGTRFFNALINSLYGARITDSQAGVRCFAQSLLSKLAPTATEYEIETEMLILALLQKATIVEVPVNRFPRSSGTSSFSRIRHGVRILSTVLRHRFPWRSR